MNAEAQGINNTLLVSLIISFVLHFVLLHMKVGEIGIEHEVSIPSQEEIQIPVEFIPGTQSLVAHQYTASELESVKKLVEEADDDFSSPKSRQKSSGIYSLNRAKAALDRYLMSVREAIEKNKYVSTPANYSRLVGNVKIGFSISANGFFSNVRIVESSGDQLLDRSALSAINSASGKTKRPRITGIKTIRTSAVIKYQYGL